MERITLRITLRGKVINIEWIADIWYCWWYRKNNKIRNEIENRIKFWNELSKMMKIKIKKMNFHLSYHERDFLSLESWVSNFQTRVILSLFVFCFVFSLWPCSRKDTFLCSSYITQLPWWLIILSSGLVGSRVFQLALKLAKIFEQKCKSNWKVQASTPMTNIGRSNVNKMDSCLVTGLIEEMKTVNLGHVWNGAIT